MSPKWETSSDWDNFQQQIYITHDDTPAGVGSDSVTFGYDYSDIPGNSSLIFYCPLTSASGTEDVKQSNTGNVNGATNQGGDELWSRNPFKFDGSNDYNDYPYLSNYNASSWSISAWVRIDDVSGAENTIVAKRVDGGNCNYAFRVEPSDNRFRTYHSINGSYYSGQVSFTFSTGTWYFFATTWDHNSNTVVTYVDGTSEGTDDMGGGASDTPNTPITIGAEQVSTTNAYFPGDIAHLMIWDKELSSTEVSNLYTRTGPAEITTGDKTA